MEDPNRNPEPTPPIKLESPTREEVLYRHYLRGYAKQCDAKLRSVDDMPPEPSDTEALWCYLSGMHTAKQQSAPKRRTVLLNDMRQAVA